MPPTLLCVQFRNLLPTEDVLLFARALWEAAQRESLGPIRSGDATLCIRKTDSKLEPYEASLALEHGSLQSSATGLDPLAAIQAAFAQLFAAPAARQRLSWSALTALPP
ncbi:MAG: hypothetical protein ABW352_07950, partial [Polyangiales bacterium]